MIGRTLGTVARRVGLGCVPVLLATAPATAQLRGDSAAVAAVERMIEAIGGRGAWASGRTLELGYRAWQVTPWAREVIELAWRDLAEPNQRIEIDTDSLDLTLAFTADGGWLIRNGTRTVMDRDRLQRSLTFWYRDFYTLLRRFAVGDPDLWVGMGSGIRVVVHSDRQGEIGWFEIASDGTPVRWGTMDDGAPLEYVYGPLREFGPLRFPAWGSSLDGTWRFEYTHVALRSAPIPSDRLAR